MKLLEDNLWIELLWKTGFLISFQDVDIPLVELHQPFLYACCVYASEQILVL